MKVVSHLLAESHIPRNGIQAIVVDGDLFASQPAFCHPPASCLVPAVHKSTVVQVQQLAVDGAQPAIYSMRYGRRPLSPSFDHKW
jgi:hypothetical protein